MKIASAGIALPEHYYPQSVLTDYLAELWGKRPEVVRRLTGLHENVQVQGRHLAYPLERYAELTTFGRNNDAWIEAATDLGERAVSQALERAGLVPADVDAIFFSTVTGLSSPSIDARLVNRLGLRPDVRRTPLFGLGCVAGAAALARATDFVRGRPDGVAVVLCVELCSLTFQREDLTVAGLIAAGLFGDGAGAAVVVGSERAAAGPTHAGGPRIVDTRSVFYPQTEDVMGWSVSEQGFRIVLSPAVPTVALERVGPDVDAFLADHRLTRSQIGSWVCHPGGPKVLAAVRDSLGLEDADLGLSWESLRRVGNLSSASALLILEATIERHRPAPGTRGVMLAMGPGFCSELLLLAW